MTAGRMRIATACLALAVTPAAARDGGQWADADGTGQWYRGLMRPDYPAISCCGEADAYWADSFEVEGDHYVAIVTDERDDGPLKRPHIEIGTRIPIPNAKMKFDQGNPTGHGVLFVRQFEGIAPATVYCYCPPGGG
jgi:hypothetical protein